jgi:acetoin utilization deacetylase AcuC-like enzyme
VSTSLTVVWDEEFLRYQLSAEHPLHPIRLGLTVDLCRALGVLDAPAVTVLPPAPADDGLLELVHTAAYLDAVRTAAEHPERALRYGMGTADATGTAVIVALPPGTDDGGWLRAFHAVVPGLVRAFRPQVLVTQCGCDSHRDDPLADLALTIDGQRAGYAALHALAHEVCEGRWLLLGGGGYGLVRCVPRAWTHLLAEAAGVPVEPATDIPPEWAQAARRRGVRAVLPTRMTEDGDTEFTPWQPGDADPVGRAVQATRRAVFPLSGLDPDDPRD